jgi:DNA primase
MPTALVFDLDPGEGAGILDAAEIAARRRLLKPVDAHGARYTQRAVTARRP